MIPNTTQPTTGPVLLDHRYYVNPDSNEIGFFNGLNLDPVLQIEPRLMEVLKLLIDGKGKVVSKERLISEVWDNYGGGEEGLLQAISKLRKVFQDDARNPKIIKTIPKKGYRLLVRAVPVEQHLSPSLANGTPTYTRPVIVQQVGLLTGFLERLMKPRFLLVFLLFSIVVLMVLGALTQLIFWSAVALGWI